MKKILALTLAVLCLLTLAACNNAADPGASTSSTLSTYATTVKPSPDKSYYFHYNNVDLIPGTEFDGGWLPTPINRQETNDCANGSRGWYNFYEYLQVDTYEEDGKEFIYAITLDPDKGESFSTPEGLCFGDDAARVEELYGKKAEKDGNVWTYKKGGTLLIIQFNEMEQVIEIMYQEA